MDKNASGPTGEIAEALGARRTAALTELARRVAGLRDMSEHAGTSDVLLTPLTGPARRKWERLARQEAEGWVFVLTEDEATVLAVDEASEAGHRDPAAAVVYPELHSRLVSWWLVHAWRSADLLADTLDSLTRWRIASGAVTARAVIEEAGALVQEHRAVVEGWEVGKAAAEGSVERPALVREALDPVLLKAGFGSRMENSHADLQATNVLTLVKKLTRETGEDRFPKWYDLLSDAAHPAFGARIAYATPGFRHESKAVMVRSYARSPMSLTDGGSAQYLEPTVALAVADSLIAAGTHIVDLLDDSLAVVDDFGLTTSAATLTRRTYWRAFHPTRGNRACPCGRGKWSACGHRWGAAGPGRT
ncbi:MULTISPECIES: hypothetical protein [Streptomyces]|uniref:hypothetical protein n=1 Tax=Streptomyces TaxID=1883 RepID=UPI0002F0B0F6|nr:hypothetical protein [Streptomyces griseus]MBW3708674.1 hypothetical protein [Streptomyces griseus]NEB57122.1 hypothetical protein [Streptomyces griseus]SEE44088.1 hypothetical protein SAMN04490359_3351 [Streptomyces griseus]SQA22006.1 Uncharacterised protein [Streptomyces griseus]